MTAPDPQITTQIEIVNKRGLHARAAAKFVKTTDGFQAEVIVSKGGTSVSGRSIMGLMMLAAATGCKIEVTATGDDAQAVIAALVALVGNRFDED